MDETRKGQIAYALIKRHVRTEGFHFDYQRLRRDLGNFSKESRISLDELVEFSKDLVGELTRETFGPQEGQEEEGPDYPGPRHSRP